MPLDEIQLYSPHGFQGQPDSCRQCSTFSGFGNDPPVDSPIGLHAAMQQILTEVQSINSKVQRQEEMISMLKESNDQLTEKFDMMEKDLLDVKQAEATKKGTLTKEGLNDHAALKVSALENGKPYEILENGGKKWHLHWLGNIDEEVNKKFIKEVADRVWDNENKEWIPVIFILDGVWYNHILNTFDIQVIIVDARLITLKVNIIRHKIREINAKIEISSFVRGDYLSGNKIAIALSSMFIYYKFNSAAFKKSVQKMSLETWDMTSL
ncbi:hypothetical protein SCLCIDRAFT_11921 [Scleroderma citrinum Foug A]|uniref:Uncharacterized protein n=1 Tax=Scleroderma citrinum Foug A TaxID=1036808 RepID=A0A0C2ZHJ3_9AGAM|nr:hypothetical protein SCLCIDRAFT_11921 [Scleroderma citrinum Foug A]